MSEDLEIPEFLKREETPEQADKRRAKYAKPDTSGGLKVVEPYTPPPDSIRRALAKEFGEPAPRKQKPAPARPGEKKALGPMPKEDSISRAIKAVTSTVSDVSVSATKPEKGRPMTTKKKVKGNGKSKVAMIADMLQRKNGCTAAEVLKATGWPSVSMPAQAKMAGLKLKKEKIDGVTRYHAA